MAQNRLLHYKDTPTMSYPLWHLIFKFAEEVDSPPFSYFFELDALARLLEQEGNSEIGLMCYAALLAFKNEMTIYAPDNVVIEKTKSIQNQIKEIYGLSKGTIAALLSEDTIKTEVVDYSLLQITCEFNPALAKSLLDNCLSNLKDIKDESTRISLTNAYRLILKKTPVSLEMLKIIFNEFEENKHSNLIYSRLILAVMRNDNLFKDEDFAVLFFNRLPNVVENICSQKVDKETFTQLIDMFQLQFDHVNKAIDILFHCKNLNTLIRRKEVDKLSILLSFDRSKFLKQLLRVDHIFRLPGTNFWQPTSDEVVLDKDEDIACLLKAGVDPSEIIEKFYNDFSVDSQFFQTVYQTLRTTLMESKSLGINRFEPLKKIMLSASARDDKETFNMIINDFPGLLDNNFTWDCIINALKPKTPFVLETLTEIKPAFVPIILEKAIQKLASYKAIDVVNNKANGYLIYFCRRLIGHSKLLSDDSFTLLFPSLSQYPSILDTLMSEGQLTPERLNRQYPNGTTILSDCLEKSNDAIIYFAKKHGGDFKYVIEMSIRTNNKKLFISCLRHMFCWDIIYKYFSHLFNDKQYMPFFLVYGCSIPKELKLDADCNNIRTTYYTTYDEARKEYKKEFEQSQSWEQFRKRVSEDESQRTADAIKFLTSHTYTLFSGPSAQLIAMLEKSNDSVSIIRNALVEELGKPKQDKQFLRKLVFINHIFLPPHFKIIIDLSDKEENEKDKSRLKLSL